MKYNRNLAIAEEEKEALARVTQDITQLQENIDNRLRKGDWEGIQSVITTRGSNPNVTVVVLIDDAGTIIGSTSLKLVGISISQALPDVDAAVLREVGTALIGRVSLSDDRRFVTAYYPVILGAKGGEIRPHRVGILHLRYDLTALKATRCYGLERQALVMAGFYAGFFLLLGLFLHLVLTRRVGRLVSAARRFAAGDLSAQTGLQGEDEIAQIGRAFDQMAREVARGHEDLQNAALKYRIVADNTYDWEFWQSPAGEFIYISPSCKRITGHEANEFLADPDLLERIIHPDDRSRFAVHRHNVVQLMLPEEIEYRIVSHDGTIRWVDHVCQPVFDEKGNFLGTRGNDRDISERKRAEEKLAKINEELEQRVCERTALLQRKTEELEQANEGLQEVDRLKSRFIASMSHELRTPLNSIIGFSSVLLSEWVGPANTEQKQNLASILRSGRHLLNMINDILDVTQIEAGTIKPVIEDFDLYDLLIDAQSEVTASIREKGLELRSEPLRQRMRTDRRRLLQCVLNILSNAAKFTDKGSVTMDARIVPSTGEAPGEEMVEIVVTDTGIGISEEDQSEIFQPFSRIVTPQRAIVPGTGLGLFLTRKIAKEILKGDILVSSEYGNGSQFSLKIPARLP